MKKRWLLTLFAPGVVFLVLCCAWPVLRIVLQTIYDDTGAVSFAGYASLFDKSFFRNSLLCPRPSMTVASCYFIVCSFSLSRNNTLNEYIIRSGRLFFNIQSAPEPISFHASCRPSMMDRCCGQAASQAPHAIHLSAPLPFFRIVVMPQSVFGSI